MKEIGLWDLLQCVAGICGTAIWFICLKSARFLSYAQNHFLHALRNFAVLVVKVLIRLPVLLNALSTSVCSAKPRIGRTSFFLLSSSCCAASRVIF